MTNTRVKWTRKGEKKLISSVTGKKKSVPQIFRLRISHPIEKILIWHHMVADFFADSFLPSCLRWNRYDLCILSGNDGEAAKSEIDVGVNEKIISENVNNNWMRKHNKILCSQLILSN